MQREIQSFKINSGNEKKLAYAPSPCTTQVLTACPPGPCFRRPSRPAETCLLQLFPCLSQARLGKCSVLASKTNGIAKNNYVAARRTEEVNGFLERAPEKQTALCRKRLF